MFDSTTSATEKNKNHISLHGFHVHSRSTTYKLEKIFYPHTSNFDDKGKLNSY